VVDSYLSMPNPCTTYPPALLPGAPLCPAAAQQQLLQQPQHHAAALSGCAQHQPTPEPDSSSSSSSASNVTAVRACKLRYAQYAACQQTRTCVTPPPLKKEN
jgi:hypothetical protein